MQLVDNVTLRTAVAAFAAAPDQATYLEVVRNCFQGDLLLDATGSTITMTDDGSAMAKGSILHFREGAGPDGGKALLAFTRQEEAAKVHAGEEVEVQTLGQPAAGLIEFAKSQGYEWVYIDPSGPTCAIGLKDIDFVLRNKRNDAVKTAIATGDPNAVVDALALGGVLLYAVAESPDSSVQVRTSVSPSGEPVRLAFTSAAEVTARDSTDAFGTIDMHRLIDDALEEPFTALVINPAGPWMALNREQLLDIQSRLPAAP